jgi:hypothetical protein
MITDGSIFNKYLDLGSSNYRNPSTKNKSRIFLPATEGTDPAAELVKINFRVEL